MEDWIGKLERAKALLDAGALTPEEFEAEKARLLPRTLSPADEGAESDFDEFRDDHQGSIAGSIRAFVIKHPIPLALGLVLCIGGVTFTSHRLQENAKQKAEQERLASQAAEYDTARKAERAHAKQAFFEQAAAAGLNGISSVLDTYMADVVSESSAGFSDYCFYGDYSSLQGRSFYLNVNRQKFSALEKSLSDSIKNSGFTPVPLPANSDGSHSNYKYFLKKSPKSRSDLEITLNEKKINLVSLVDNSQKNANPNINLFEICIALDQFAPQK